jgi:hypothetical protein
MRTPLREVAWYIVGLSFDEPLVRPNILYSGVNHDLQESVAWNSSDTG